MRKYLVIKYANFEIQPPGWGTKVDVVKNTNFLNFKGRKFVSTDLPIFSFMAHAEIFDLFFSLTPGLVTISSKF